MIVIHFMKIDLMLWELIWWQLTTTCKTQFYQLFGALSICLNVPVSLQLIAEQYTKWTAKLLYNWWRLAQLQVCDMQAWYFYGVSSFIVKNSCMLQAIWIDYMAWHIHHTHVYIQTRQLCNLKSSTHPLYIALGLPWGQLPPDQLSSLEQQS